MICNLRPLPAICERFVRAGGGDLPACRKCPYEVRNAKPTKPKGENPDIDAKWLEWLARRREARDYGKPMLSDEQAPY